MQACVGATRMRRSDLCSGGRNDRIVGVSRSWVPVKHNWAGEGTPAQLSGGSEERQAAPQGGEKRQDSIAQSLPVQAPGLRPTMFIYLISILGNVKKACKRFPKAGLSGHANASKS